MTKNQDFENLVKGMDRTQLANFCRAILFGLEGESEKAESKEPKKDEPKSESGSEGESENKEESAGGPQFVFLGVNDVAWPKSKGTSMRERQLAKKGGE